MRLLSVFALCLALPAAALGQAQERLRLGLAPVEGARGVPPSIPAQVQGMLEEALSQSGRFELVERSRLKEVLEEVSFQQSGLTDVDKAAQVGQHLNVQKLVFAQVASAPSGYRLSLKVVDVNTNQVVRAEEENLGRSQAQIQAAVDRVARRLAAVSSLLSPAAMVFFPGGAFSMGSARDSEAGPPHLVSLSPFYLDRHEVSQIAYYAFRQARGERLPLPEQPDLPAGMVSWEEASAYCQAQGKRLPTEAEWEYAARSGEDRLYPWGNAAPTSSLARFGGQSRGPVAVDALPQGATPQGVYHLAGNAAEWVQDWWAPGYAVPGTPPPLYSVPGVVSGLPAPLADPTGPEQGDFKVVRGGSWTQPAEEIAATARAYHNPDKGAAYIGFRCARSAPADSSSGQ